MLLVLVRYSSANELRGKSVMVQFDLLLRLPTSDELADSDETPVDNEIQNPKDSMQSKLPEHWVYQCRT